MIAHLRPQVYDGDMKEKGKEEKKDAGAGSPFGRTYYAPYSGGDGPRRPVEVGGLPELGIVTIRAAERDHLERAQKAILDLQKAAVPQWTPGRDSTGWTAHEWLRAGSGNSATTLLPTGQSNPWRRLEVASPDPDEMCLMRIVHNVAAEAIEPLRGPYRRAYERVAAEGVPLHIDRRMDATLPDLIRNTAQSEVSALWELALQAATIDANATGWAPAPPPPRRASAST
jgi:hypothetical protein